MNIILVGFMGCGKTTIGKKLSRVLHFNFIDTDSLFEKENNISVFDYFSTHGEEQFRKIEQELLIKTLQQNNNTVISTGGGTPCNYNNMELINKNGISIYIKMSVQSLTVRLLYSYKKRPLIKDFEEESELKNYIEETLNEREPYYSKANHTIKGESISMEELIKLVKSENKLMTSN
jgi:shikimate kinase